MIKFQGIGAQGNYSQAGKAVADDTLRSFLAARRNSPNYGEMAITAADIRKKEKLATLKNQAEVAATRLTADADVKAKKMGIEAKSSLNTAKRKAGALGLAGQLFGKISDAGGEKPLEPYKGRYSREELQGDIDKYESEAKTIKDGIVVPEKPDFSTPGLSTPSSSGGGSGSTNSLPTGTSSGGSLGTRFSQGELETFAINAGADPSKAPTFAKIGMAESGGWSGNDTVQSGLDANQDNEYSIGLWQINTQAHGDKLARRGWTKDDLRDPVKNATIALEVYNEAGGSFTPWGAYNNGSYAKF